MPIPNQMQENQILDFTVLRPKSTLLPGFIIIANFASPNKKFVTFKFTTA